MINKILFLCQFFYPERNSSATLPFDIAKALAAQGYKVDAICGEPKEYSSQTNVPLRETVDGVGVRRLKYLQLSKSSKLGRLINYFSFTLSVLINFRKLKEYDAVVVYSNPPVLPIVPILANRLWSTKLVFVSYDVYPEVAQAMGSIKETGPITWAMKLVNKQLSKRATKVVALTEQMRQFLIKNRPELTDDRVCVIPNWAHEENVPDYSISDVRQRYGLPEDSFLVSYVGNMGICQDMKTIGDAVLAMKDVPDVHFLLAGQGVKRDELVAFIKAENLKNVTLLEFLDADVCHELTKASDCCIVSLECGLSSLCAPSKYYSYLYAGKPIIVIAEKESYIAKEVETEKIGFSVEQADVEKMVSSIVYLSENTDICAQYSARSYELYDNRYSFSVALKKYMEMFDVL